MKKSSAKKSAVSPAPATTKATLSASAPAGAKKHAAAKSAPAPVKAAAPAVPLHPPAAASAPLAAFTVVTAQIDVGFGNTLHIRGEGPGLSWNKGLPLQNARANQWTISLPRVARPIVFKFLLNDQSWSEGEDYKAEPGASVLLRPAFSQG